jgi:predicted DCC family thiol-disulfide oxidoreductase YuxK
VRLIQALDRDRRVTAVPYQKPGVPALAGLTIKECEKAAWAIAPDGQRYRGAGAVNASYAVATGVALPLLVYALPVVKQMQDLAYAFVAANRSSIPLPSVVPYCKEHPEECR